MDILKLEQLTHEKWLNLFAATYRHNSHEGRWVFASRNAKPYSGGVVCNAVVMVPILHAPDQPPRLVMVKEFRVPVADYVYALPAGLIDEGETIEATVCREIIEETGFEVTAIKRVTPPLMSSSGLSDEAAAMAFIDVRATPASTQALEGSEDIEVLLLDYAAVCALCDDTTIRHDAKAWTILYMYQQLGKFA